MNTFDYFEAWALADGLEIASTPTSVVYKVMTEQGPAVFKILTSLGKKDESDGAATLSYFDGYGAVRVLRSDAQALLLSFADGPFLKDLSVSGQDRKATEIARQVIQKLHSKRANPQPVLRTLPELFASFIVASESANESILSDCALIASELLESESEKVVLHGDLHHKNIIESSSGAWLAIDPKGYFGERTFDLANFFYNPDDQPHLVESAERIVQIADYFSQEFSIERSRILKFAFAFGGLSAYWAVQDGQDASRRLRIARLIQELMGR